MACVRSWGQDEHRLFAKNVIPYHIRHLWIIQRGLTQSWMAHARCRCPRCWISLLFSAVLLSLQGNPYTASLSTHILFICLLVCLFLSSPFILDKSVTMKKIGQVQPWPMFSNLYDEFNIRTFHSYTKCYFEWLIGKAQPMLLPWYRTCGPEVIWESCFTCEKLLKPCPSIW